MKAGSALVAQAGHIIQDMVQSVKDVSAIVGEIAVAAEEQSGRIGSISHAVTQLDDTLQQNAAMVEESAAASENLKEQARNLTHIVSTFRLSRSAPLSTRLENAASPRSTHGTALLGNTRHA